MVRQVKQIFFSLFTTAVFILAPYSAIAEPAPEPASTATPEEPRICRWRNPYALTGRKDEEGNPITTTKEETVTRQPRGGRDSDELESCAEAVAKARSDKERKFSTVIQSSFRGKRIGNSPENCQYRPPIPNSKAEKLTLKKMRDPDEPDGELIDEPCSQAQNRAEMRWINEVYEGNHANVDLDIKNQSLSQSSRSASSSAKTKGIIAGAGAVATGVKAVKACKAQNYGLCAMFFGISAALGNAALELVQKSDEYKHIANQYEGRITAGGTDGGTSTAGTSTASTSTAGTSTAGTSTAGTSTASTSTAGTSTAGTSTAGTSTAGDPSPTNRGRTTAGTVRGGGGQKDVEIMLNGQKIKVATTPKGLQNQLNRQLNGAGVKVSGDGNKITMPDGRTYTREELANMPAVKNYLSSPEGKKLMNELKNHPSLNVADSSASDADSSDSNTGQSAPPQVAGAVPYGGHGWDYGAPGGGVRGEGEQLEEETSSSEANDFAVQHGNDRVGVSQGNIFVLAARRYDNLEAKGVLVVDLDALIERAPTSD